MSIMIERGPMTKMYEFVWDGIGKWLLGSFYQANGGNIVVLTDRLGIWSGVHHPSWFHICNPRLIYWLLKEFRVQDRKLKNTDFVHIIQKHTCYTSMTEIHCRNCKYELTKQEQLLVKLGVIGEKR